MNFRGAAGVSTAVLLALVVPPGIPAVAAKTYSAPPAEAQTTAFSDTGTKLVFSNGYVHLEFNKSNPAIDVIKGDFGGNGSYGANLLAENTDGRRGIVLESVNSAGVLFKSSTSGSPAAYTVLQNDAAGVKVRISNIKDSAPGVNSALSTWTIALDSGSRKFTLSTSTSAAATRTVKAIKISAYTDQWFMAGLYARGVVQNVNSGDQFLSSADALKTFYTMDAANGSLAVVPTSQAGIRESNVVSGSTVFKTGLEQVMVGAYPGKDSWSSSGWGGAANVNVVAGAIFTADYDIFPNNYAFPTHTVRPGSNMDFNNLRAFYTAVYGSAAGTLGSYGRRGSSYPTIAAPGRPYGATYNYFDPDAWSTVATLSFSGDAYLQEEARKVLELSGNNLLSGQIPHHFDNGSPVYVALSGARQTGPNVFWLLAAVDYVTATGNTTWLNAHYAEMRSAANWLLTFYDPTRKLLKAPGPLWIDVFIRQDFALDTNAFMLRLLPLMASVARTSGDATSAAVYSQRATDIKAGINTGLWNGDNHYVTQRNADWSVRDLVDYDANFAVIGFRGTTDPARVSAMFDRLDGGASTHPGGRGTWPSELYYGPSETYGGNTGDSAVALGRIWWADMLARYVTGTGKLSSFNQYYTNVRSDLFINTWMKERYDPSGKLTRADYYHEYPELISMVMREMVYGIDIKLDTVTIKPYGTGSYDYNVGNLAVSYTAGRVTMSIPGSGTRIYNVHGLYPDHSYAISSGGAVTTDGSGAASFSAPVGTQITIAGSTPPTAERTTGGIVSSQYTDAPVGEAVANAFDDATLTKYVTFHNAGWVQYRFADGNRHAINKYAVTSAGDFPERDPRGWTVTGSNDGSHWTVLDTRAGETFADRFQRKEYTLSNDAQYEYLRIDFTNNGGAVLQFAEIELYRTAVTSLFTDRFDDNVLGAAWATRNGVWSESGQILSQTGTANQDPKKAVIAGGGLSATAPYVITARVRVDSWSDDDGSRAGVGLSSSTTNGYGYNLLFHGDHSTLQFLEDGVLWSPPVTFNWTEGTWYWFKLKAENGILYGKVWADGATEPGAWTCSWPRSGLSGYPALNGGSGRTGTTSFDDVTISAS